MAPQNVGVTQPHPLPMDSYTDHLLRTTKFLMENLRCFRNAGRKSIYADAEQYTLWEAQRGTPKGWVKWLAPIFTNSTAKNKAAAIFGKEPSPITLLGNRPVSAYIRHLLFGKHRSKEWVAHHLIQQHGYDYASAMPTLLRILREEDSEKTQGKQSRYYREHHEAAMFPEGIVSHGVSERTKK